VYRLITSLEGKLASEQQQNGVQRATSVTSWSKRGENSSRVSNNNQQYHRLKSTAPSLNQHQYQQQLLQQHSVSSLKKRTGSASNVRKLGTMRGNNRANYARNYEKEDGILLNDILFTQMKG
jgi:hypothetical protein